MAGRNSTNQQLPGWQTMSKHSGWEWIQDTRKYWNGKPEPISELGKKVADLLGQVYGGIYHLDSGALSRVDWTDEHHIEFILSHRDLDTYDGSELTDLVLLCHMMNIHMSIDAASYRRLRLSFQRVTRRGFFRDGHPTLGDAIKRAQRLFVGETI